ncbi:MAG: imelysin family protein [Lautropia sp.]
MTDRRTAAIPDPSADPSAHRPASPRAARSRRSLLSALTALAGGSALAAGTALLPSRAAAQQPPARSAIDAVVAQYAKIVSANYQDAHAGALELQKAIRSFIAKPSQTGLEQARKAWLAAREWYGQSEAFRFYGGPIDADDGPEGRINAWPMDEAYIDGVQDRADAGVINDRKVAITRKLLIDLNERDGEENISTGWHAIEFLLWGQDLRDDGPGDRPHTDFVDGRKPNADRRRRYLDVVGALLVDDLKSLVDAWAPGRPKNYRAGFERGGIESVRKIIVGIGSLSRGELAGERLEVAMNTQDQEDEHSCFSDNTHRDAVTNALGIENVWLGRYKRRDGTVVEGASLRDLVAKADPALAERTTRSIAASLAATEAIQAPFDREIIGTDDAPGRKRVRAAIDSLVAQSRDLVDGATALGITRLTLTQP